MSGGRLGGWMPLAVALEPGGSFHMRRPVDHADVPTGGPDGAVVEPAQQHPVVGMSRPAFGVRDDVVDLGGRGGDGAAGDDAATIAEGDCLALVRGEAPSFGAE